MKNYNNFTIGIELTTSQTNIWTNVTEYDKMCETINKYVEINQYKYKSKGWPNKTIYDGEY